MVYIEVDAHVVCIFRLFQMGPIELSPTDTPQNRALTVKLAFNGAARI